MPQEGNMYNKTYPDAKSGQKKLRNQQAATPGSELYINEQHNARKEALGPNTKRRKG